MRFARWATSNKSRSTPSGSIIKRYSCISVRLDELLFQFIESLLIGGIFDDFDLEDSLAVFLEGFD